MATKFQIIDLLLCVHFEHLRMEKRFDSIILLLNKEFFRLEHSPAARLLLVVVDQIHRLLLEVAARTIRLLLVVIGPIYTPQPIVVVVGAGDPRVMGIVGPLGLTQLPQIHPRALLAWHSLATLLRSDHSCSYCSSDRREPSL